MADLDPEDLADRMGPPEDEAEGDDADAALSDAWDAYMAKDKEGWISAMKRALGK